MDYKFGNKNNWRRWAWNRIEERVAHKRNGIILFLAGPDAADIAEARRRGFDVRNMIAIEKDPAVVSLLRSAGVLTIDGDLTDVLYSWPLDRDVSVIVADFCSGLEDKIIGCFQTVLTGNPSFYSSVIVGNFLRGRDKSSNYYRSYLADGFDGMQKQLHRGMFFYAAATVTFWDAIKDHPPVVANHFYVAKLLRDKTNPDYFTYRSTAGTQRFDSAVFVNPASFISADSVRSELRGMKKIIYEDESANARFDMQRRKNAAVLAHHTMRKAG